MFGLDTVIKSRDVCPKSQKPASATDDATACSPRASE
jgi:hypothetical protein